MLRLLLLKRKALELVSRWAHSSPGEACHNILLSHPICPWSIDQSAYLGNCTQVRCNRLRHPETWLMVNHADHSTGTLNWILPPAWNIGARQRWTSSGSPPHANSYVWVFILLVVVWGINTSRVLKMHMSSVHAHDFVCMFLGDKMFLTNTWRKLNFEENT